MAPTTPVKSRDFAPHPSTTPIGPPPSSAASFTPQGPPPSSFIGSSYLGPGSYRKSNLSFSESAFDQSVNSEASEPDFAFSTTSSSFPLPPTRDRSPPKSFLDSQRSGPSFSVNSNNAGHPVFSPASSAFSQQAQSIQLRPEQAASNFAFPPSSPQVNLGSPHPAPPLRSSRQPVKKPLIYSNPNNAKRPKLDETWVGSSSPAAGQDRPKKRSSAFSAIAQDLAARATPAPLDEPSPLILHTEDVVCRMYDQARERDFDAEKFSLQLSEVTEDLLKSWKGYSKELTSAEDLSVSGGIGPGDSAPSILKACFIGSLIVPLHHPPLLGEKSVNGLSQSGVRPPFRSLIQLGQTKTKSPIPKVLFDWIDFFHSPRIGHVDALRATQPNVTSSPKFWDIVLDSVFRANFSQAVQLLEVADFSYAKSAMEDGHEQPGYHGSQLQNIQGCVNKAMQLLRTSPGAQQDDWDIKGLEWVMYRKRVASAVAELEDFAEGASPPSAADGDSFDAPHFGLSGRKSVRFTFSQSARMAESKVPWTVYQSLKTLYNIILGDAAALLSRSQDWVEATVGLAAWWDGEDDSDITLKSSTRRSSPKRSASRAPRSVDLNPEDAYLRRLDYAFGCVTDSLGKDGFQVNSMSPVEVGLASVFEGNVDGVLQLLRTWSLSVASAVAEVATFGGWLETAAGSEPLPGFNESERMVLNYNQRERRIRKDDLLLDYASAVFHRPRLEARSGVREGWEISLQILRRLDDPESVKSNVGQYLDRVSLDTSDQMDKMVLLCTDLGFGDEARRVSERYGDKVAESSGEYGTSLIYYSRARAAQKIKNIIDLLISFCLIQSRAYPPEAELDQQLRTLLRHPKSALGAVAAVDAEGAAMLQFYFSGYATLRSFYEIRDEEVLSGHAGQSKRRPLARKRAAAGPLVTAVVSAADSIYGGLYDPSRKTAIQVDGLLVLLGEVLGVADSDLNRFFTTEQQLNILAAIEDLQTVTPRVYQQCEECLQAAFFHYAHYERHDSSSGTSSSMITGSFSGAPSFPASPRNLLKKSVSSMTALSGFSLIGSEMVDSQSRSQDSIGGSGVLVPRPKVKADGGGEPGEVKRGWDWRSTLSQGAKGEDILRELRQRLARALSLGTNTGAMDIS